MVLYDRKVKEALKYFISVFLSGTVGCFFGNVLSRELPHSVAFRKVQK